MTRRTSLVIATIGVTTLGIVLILAFGLQYALDYQPDFYAAAISTPHEVREQTGREFEHNVLELHNDLRRQGRWKHVFTQKQVNSWLDLELPKKFPDLLPPSIEQPRVAFTPQQIHLAFRYESERIATVIDLTLDVALADEPNTLAVRLRQARAGRIPLPLKSFLDDISRAAAEADIALRWAQHDQDPVALISLTQPAAEDSQTVLELIAVDDGTLTLAGTTVK